LTFATGCTVALVFVDSSIFAVVASNYIYATVTACSCVIGPIINLAERYGRIINRQLGAQIGASAVRRFKTAPATPPEN
jgi:hypothetical protein